MLPKERFGEVSEEKCLHHEESFDLPHSPFIPFSPVPLYLQTERIIFCLNAEALYCCFSYGSDLFLRMLP